jgi:hypothetical protein
MSRALKPPPYWPRPWSFKRGAGPAFADRTEIAAAGATVFISAGVAHTYSAGAGARYLIVLTPRLISLISALQLDREPPHIHAERFPGERLLKDPLDLIALATALGIDAPDPGIADE